MGVLQPEITGRPGLFFLWTLSFQCRDGPSLRDKLVDLVQKKPGKTTDLQHPGLSVSTEQATQPHYGKQTVVRSAIVDYRSMTRDRKL